MAKKKKTHKRTHHRRRGMGAIHTGNLMHTLTEFAGAGVGGLLATAIQRRATTLNPKLLNAGQIVAGVMFRNNKHTFVRGAALGLGTAGMIGFAHDVGLIHGIDEIVAGVFPDGGGDFEMQTQHGIPNGSYVNGLQNGSFVAGGGAEEVPYYHNMPLNDPYNPGVLTGVGALGMA